MGKIISALALVALVIALVIGGIIPVFEKGKDSAKSTQTSQTTLNTKISTIVVP